MAQKILNFLVFPVGPIAVSVFMVWNSEKVKEWIAGKDVVSKEGLEVEVNGDLLMDPETGKFWVAERRGSFTVQFDEGLL